MSADWMPPLPLPVAQRVPNARGRHDYWDFGETYSAELDPESLYTADQMRQARADAARAALEHHARVMRNELVSATTDQTIRDAAAWFATWLEMKAKEITP